METALTFNEVTLTPVTHENRLWIKATELARALGYASEKSVSVIYARHKDEFSNDMSEVINLITTDGQEGLESQMRVFSPRGCHLVAMFARSRVAKKFRKWVLDVLDKVCNPEPEPAALPSVDAPINPDQQCTLRSVVKGKVEAIPVDQRPRGIYPYIWSRFNNHFRLARYCQLPQSRLSEAIEYLMQMEIPIAALPPAKPEGLPVPVEPAVQLRTLHAARQKCRFEFIPRGYAPTDLKAAQRSKLCFDLYQMQDNFWAMLYNICSAIQHIHDEK